SGSLYINKKDKIIFKKQDKKWNRELVLRDEKYMHSKSILIKEDSNGKKIKIRTGTGIESTEQGISALIDTSALSMIDNEIRAKSDQALWNANKLQGRELTISTPTDGQVLKYTNGKWTNGSGLTYKSGPGI